MRARPAGPRNGQPLQRRDDCVTLSGVSPCAICQTISPLLRSIAVMRPYGGLTSGSPCTVSAAAAAFAAAGRGGCAAAAGAGAAAAGAAPVPPRQRAPGQRVALDVVHVRELRSAAAPARAARSRRVRVDVRRCASRDRTSRPASSCRRRRAACERRQRAVDLADDRRREDRPDLVLRRPASTASARSSGVKSIRSSIDTPWRSYAGGLVGNGCVGEYHSPGTSPFATGRSSIGQTGWPVTRSNT